MRKESELLWGVGGRKGPSQVGMADGRENNAGWVQGDNNGGETGWEARKQGELEQ